MKTVRIGNTVLDIKDYHCAYMDEEDYVAKDGKLWLYVNVTNKCQASCPFCVSAENKDGENLFDIVKFQNMLKVIKGHIYGISITGGEPLLEVQLIDDIIDVIYSEFPEMIEIDMVTNGVRLASVCELRNLDRLTSIHISRHRIDDVDNRLLMGANTPTIEEISSIAGRLKDPGKLVFNCVLQRGGVDSIEKVKQYLEMAAMAGVSNSSFVGMFLANDYCREHYVDPRELNWDSSEDLMLWHRYHDYDYCCCSTGSYRANAGMVGYYYRCPGKSQTNYARQLVYTSDNKLLGGFGGTEIVIN